MIMPEKVEVKNLHEGNRKPLWSNSWIEYWLENNKNYKVKPICPRCGMRESTDGAHVIKVNSLDDKWYIVPLCENCNEKKDDEPFLVKKDMLVCANSKNL